VIDDVRSGTTLTASALLRGANTADQEVCDTEADFALGQEDYSNAVILHSKLLSFPPDDALAHYHFHLSDKSRADERISSDSPINLESEGYVVERSHFELAGDFCRCVAGVT